MERKPTEVIVHVGKSASQGKEQGGKGRRVDLIEQMEGT